MQNGINTDHYSKVVQSRIEHDLPVGGVNVFVAQRIEPNEPEDEQEEPDFITDRDLQDEQPADNIEFRNAMDTTKILNNLFSNFSKIF